MYITLYSVSDKNKLAINVIKTINLRYMDTRILTDEDINKMDLENLKGIKAPIVQRMYSMVLRQLTPMQKGIQSLHAVVDYSEMMKNDAIDEDTKNAYDTWANHDKTMIVLDAGTSQDLQDAITFLRNQKIIHKVFCEPDLYDMPTAVCFIADERVWDTKQYPSYEQYVAIKKMEADKSLEVKDNDGKVIGTNMLFIQEPRMSDWVREVFGNIDPRPIMELREFIFSKKLSL